MSSTEYWEKAAKSVLLGKKIVAVRYMTDEEAETVGFHSRPVVIQLSDGNLIYPSMDDEGNDGGALFTQHEKHGTLPVLSLGFK